MKSEIWELIKKFYVDNFNIEPELVEVMSDYDILVLCVSGSSCSSISLFLELDEQDVRNTIKKYFKFLGWDKDLEINPIRIYKSIKDVDFHTFKELVCKEGCEEFVDNDIYNMYESSLIFSKLEEIINENWI